jgi:flagellar biosynthetic protein FliO
MDPAPISGQAILAIIITIGLMAVVARFLSKGAAARRSSKAIHVETAVSLGERRSLVVVAVEGRRLLLGMTPSQVTLVTELERTFEKKLDQAVGPSGSQAVSAPDVTGAQS